MFRFHGHISKSSPFSLDVGVYEGGYKNNEIETSVLSLEHLSILKQNHDEKYAPDKLAATMEAERLAKIHQLQKQIDELEVKK